MPEATADGKGLQIKRRGALVVVSAPSGAGKTTLCHEVRSLVPNLGAAAESNARSASRHPSSRIPR